MTTQLIFTNPGLLDLRLLTTFGASVKVGASPFGKFGTGLKYALAGLARLGAQRVEIWLGEQKYVLCTEIATIRGKEFERLYLAWTDSDSVYHSLDLPFTTELGQHWEPWMICRELLANTIDEQGYAGRRYGPDGPQGYAGETMFVIECEALSSIEPGTFWLGLPKDFQPRTAYGPGLESAPNTSGTGEDHLFYRGFRVTPEPEKGAPRYVLTWNLLSEQALSEDRMLVSRTDARQQIADGLAAFAGEALWEALLAAPSAAELALPFNHYEAPEPGKEFKRFWLSRVARKKFVPYEIRQLLKRKFEVEFEKAEDLIEVPQAWSDMLGKAPKCTASPRTGDLYDFVDEVSEERKELLAQVAWWRACAESLQQRLAAYNTLGEITNEFDEEDAAQDARFVPDDEIPF